MTLKTDKLKSFSKCQKPERKRQGWLCQELQIDNPASLCFAPSQGTRWKQITLQLGYQPQSLLGPFSVPIKLVLCLKISLLFFFFFTKLYEVRLSSCTEWGSFVPLMAVYQDSTCGRTLPLVSLKRLLRHQGPPDFPSCSLGSKINKVTKCPA